MTYTESKLREARSELDRWDQRLRSAYRIPEEVINHLIERPHRISDLVEDLRVLLFRITNLRTSEQAELAHLKAAAEAEKERTTATRLWPGNLCP